MLALLLPVSARSQDNVTIPKSRLEELERKEKELEQLKGQKEKATTPQQPALQPATNSSGAAPPAQPAAPVYQSPPLSSLPPFKDGETVEALDLASFYRQDPIAAEQRYRNHKLVVRGEIAGFEKPMLQRNYRVLLKTADRDTRIVCDLLPPERFSAVFPINHGSKLVGLERETRVPIAKTGDLVLVAGRCKGFSDGTLMISASGLNPAK